MVLIPSATCKVVVDTIDRIVERICFYNVDAFGRPSHKTLVDLRNTFRPAEWQVVFFAAAYCGNCPSVDDLQENFKNDWKMVLDRTHAPAYTDAENWDFQFESSRKFAGSLTPTIVRVTKGHHLDTYNPLFRCFLLVNALVNAIAFRFLRLIGPNQSNEFDGWFLAGGRKLSESSLLKRKKDISELSKAWVECLRYVKLNNEFKPVLDGKTSPSPLLCVTLTSNHNISDALKRIKQDGIKTITWPSLPLKQLPSDLKDREISRKNTRIYIPVNQFLIGD